MSHKIRRYTGKDIDVLFDVKRCIHAEECVINLPEVFDTSRRPWIMPENAPSSDRLAEVVVLCPTGAIHYEYKSREQVETPPDTNTIRIMENGPLYVYGHLVIQSSDGEFSLEENRAAFCRCGATHNKPFCDNSHKDVDFSACSGIEGDAKIKIVPLEENGHLEITFKADRVGSITIKGPLKILDSNNEVIYQDNRASVCTCGLSNKKPFCDASHRKLNE